MSRVMQLAAVAVAGGLGAVARDMVDRVLTKRSLEARLPIGILVVNLTGSLALGLLIGAGDVAGDDTVLIAGAGFLGAFTTFSTFAVQAVRLPRQDGVRYVALTLIGCLATAAAGLAIGSAAV